MPEQAGDDPELDGILSAAVARFQADLARTGSIAARVHALVQRTPGTAPHPAQALRDPRSFPVMQLPVWLSRTLSESLDRDFHVDVACSSLNAYYFIRLVDNVMDADGPAELRRLLPAAAVFHARFQLPYQRHFPAGHPFWDDFERWWSRAAVATVEDAFLECVDAERFVSVSGLKFSAAAVPLAAAAHAGGRPDLVPAWAPLVDRLGGWYQLLNDLLDWHHDSRHGIRTWFLSEFTRRGAPAESLPAWVAREGFDWAVELLESWMAELLAGAAVLKAPALGRFLAGRLALFRRQVAEARNGLRGMRVLLRAFA